MTDAQKEQREKAIERSGGYCAVCGKPLKYGSIQYAHAIGNTQVNRKKYGSFFIDSTFNGAMVCSLECNAKVDVGKSKGKILDKLADILIAEIKTSKIHKNSVDKKCVQC
jgi:hypothetical protein